VRSRLGLLKRTISSCTQKFHFKAHRKYKRDIRELGEVKGKENIALIGEIEGPSWDMGCPLYKTTYIKKLTKIGCKARVHTTLVGTSAT